MGGSLATVANFRCCAGGLGRNTADGELDHRFRTGNGTGRTGRACYESTRGRGLWVGLAILRTRFPHRLLPAAAPARKETTTRNRPTANTQVSGILKRLMLELLLWI